MKKLLGIVILSLLFSSKSYAESNCLKMLNGYVPDDDSIKVAHLTEKALTLYINNIRNMKDIDIVAFGFNQSMADLMQKKYNCPKTRFIKAYDSNGVTQPLKINGKLLKDYTNQVIVLEK